MSLYYKVDPDQAEGSPGGSTHFELGIIRYGVWSELNGLTRLNGGIMEGAYGKSLDALDMTYCQSSMCLRCDPGPRAGI
jgi:hypothetical protein